MAKFKAQTQLEKTIKNINDKTMYGLNLDDMKESYALVNNEDIFCDILVRIANNPNVDSYVYMQRLTFAVQYIYPRIVNGQDNLQAFFDLLNIYLSNPELITLESLENLNNVFSEKSLIYETYLYLNQEDRFKDLNGVNLNNINLITEYLTKAREFYVDDRALYGSFINLIKNNLGIDALKYGNSEQIEAAINLKVKEDRKANGVYDIDESTIREFDRKIESMGLLVERLNTLVETAENTRVNLSSDIDSAKEEISATRISEMRALSEEARNKISEFNKTYSDLLKQQKKTVYDERDRLLSEIDEYIKKKKQEIEVIVTQTSGDVAFEISRLQKASNDSIDTLRNYVSNDESIKKIIQEASKNDDFLNRVAIVENIVAKMDDRPIIQAGKGTKKAKGASDQVATVSEKIVVPNQTILVPTTEIDEVVDYAVNYYFDKSKKYRERFKKLIDRKNKMETDNNEIFHAKFDDVLAMIIENDCPYMYGPSGCGKTYMIEEQLAKLLAMEIITNGYILYEQDVIGYNNAGNGGFVKTNFYRAYRGGKLLFFDELDNSNSNATTILNAFLKRSGNTSYAFPNGETIPRHPNFRIIAAGNTKGTGKTVAHNTRQKMDESVMQRVTPIAIGYDNRIEKRILKDYPGWFEFAVLFREAVEKCPLNGKGDEPNSIGTFTTRDAEAIRDYKDDGAFVDENNPDRQDEKLIDYQIIENKDIDYLENIKRNMDTRNLKTDEGKKLLRLFDSRVAEMKKNAF